MTQSIEAEVAVVGAGLVGLAAAIAFAKQGKKTVLVDSKNPAIKLKKAWDERVYALTPATEQWLSSLGIWAHVDVSRVSAINSMHLFEDASEQALELNDQDAHLTKLGLIIENQNLMHALIAQLKTLDVTIITDVQCVSLHNTRQAVTINLANGVAITAKFVVAADGVDSWVRKQANIGVAKKDFNQTAIVANFSAEKTHSNVARQWFLAHETLALLPLVGRNVSLVWAVSTERADELLKLSNKDLADAVCVKSQGVLGDLTHVGKTQCFTLQQQTATGLIAQRVVLMGDAAHQIHPMAGQGVNLGFRDVMQMAAITTNCHAMQDIGCNTILRQYERARAADVATMNMLTTGLDSLFSTDNRLLKKLTHWGFMQINKQASVKKLLVQQVAT